MPDEEFEGLTVEETDALNEDAVKANEPVEPDLVEAWTLPPLPNTEITSVSPVDPESDPGKRKAALEAEESEGEEPVSDES